jgi:phage terminase large subunit-like protein
VPRKQGKTLLSASICNFMLFCDGEPGAEIYAAAAERDQAAILFEMAKQQVEAEPTLLDAAEIFKRAIVLKGTNSSFKVVSSDARKKHGYNAHLLVIDELHAIRNRELVDALTTGSGARRQPLVVYQSTADFAGPSICNEKLEYARKVRDGAVSNPAFLPVIYEADVSDDWKDPAVWARVNPGLGISVPVDYFRTECQKAQDTPTYENTFRRLYLNVQTEQDVRFIGMDRWDACGSPFNQEELRGKPCFGGLDLATTTDVAAFVLVFPWTDGSYRVLCFFWIPADNARKKEDRDQFPYLTVARQGFLDLTEGNVIDYDRIRAKILDLSKSYDIRDVGVDRWNATQITEQLTKDGLTLTAFGQGFKDMNAPTKELEKLVLSGRFLHGGNPVLKWMASNVSVETDAAGNLKPSKKKSTKRIDGIVASIMALGRAMVNPVKRHSVYTKDRGLLRL